MQYIRWRESNGMYLLYVVIQQLCINTWKNEQNRFNLIQRYDTSLEQDTKLR